MKIESIISEEHLKQLKEANKSTSELTEKLSKLFEIAKEKKETERLLNFWDIINVVKSEYPDIRITSTTGKQIDHANKFLAIFRLMILADYYNDGWVADWENENQQKWAAGYLMGDIRIEGWLISNYGVVYFKSKELLQTAIENNREIFEAALKQ
jgi:hypothetical protein